MHAVKLEDHSGYPHTLQQQQGYLYRDSHCDVWPDHGAMISVMWYRAT